MKSLWTQTAHLPSFPALEGHQEADAVIIGGGLAGILTADALQQAGADVILLEANRIGRGQTAGTTAKLTAQHGLKYHSLIRSLGMDAAAQYAAANLKAVEHLKHLVQTRDIDCNFQDCTSFLFAVEAPGPLLEEYHACRRLGMDVFLTTDTELPFSVQALGLRNQAMFHPMKLLAALAQNLTIYEHSRVLSVDEHTVHTQHGTVTAEKIIFCCHYPFPNVPGFYFLRQHQERSYVLALEDAAPLQNYYLGVDGQKFSLRSHGQTLLLGGSGHRTGENTLGDNYKALEAAAKRFWPQSHISAHWSAQDCIPMDGIPYIGSYARSHPDWLIATGFQKWGMSSSVVASMILSDLAQTRPPIPEANLFTPQRFHPAASAKQLADDTVHAVCGLGRRVLAPGRISVDDLPPGNGGVVEIDGKKMGVYRNEQGELLVVSVKCPHLGCQLEWNPAEKSWDCPCHGSRFDVNGTLLNGPANSNL